MKTKILLALAMSLTTVSAFANSMELPTGLVDLHAKACPEFIERNLYVDIQKLPNGPEFEANNTLYVMGCEMYAYNSLEKAYVVNPQGVITPVVVAEVVDEGKIVATSDLMGAGYDATTNTLGTFQKGRGIGDCGSSATYKWDPRNEKFVLEEARVKMECDGEETEWPVVYKK